MFSTMRSARRWLVNSTIGILLAGLLLSFALPPATYAQTNVGWLTGYTYRVALWATGSPDGAQTNYQLPINIYPMSDAPSANNTISLNSHNATATLDDIRFVTDDGTTTLDFWLEYWDYTYAVVWVEFDSLPAHPRSQMFYMYYGNAGAANASSGANTFIVFDDFERGINGDPIGGAWTVTAGAPTISTVQDIGDVAGYTGSRSYYHDAAESASIPVAHSNNIASRFRYYKVTLADLYYRHGDATKTGMIRLKWTDDIMYVTDAGEQDSGADCTPLTWELFEIADYDWTANTYDIYLNDGRIWNDADMFTSGAYTDIGELVGTQVEDLWIDNFIVRNYTENEPWVEAWGNEHRNAGVQTRYISGRGAGWGIMNGYIAGVHTGSTVSQRGFDYGLTQAMGISWVEAGAWTASATFSRVQTGLSTAGTTYFYRAKVYDGTAWSYGQQRRLSLSPQQYEWWEEEDDYLYPDATGDNWLFQTFTVDDIAFSLESVDVKLLRVGALATDTLTLNVRMAGTGEPSRENLATGTIDADLVSATAPTWYKFTLDTEISVRYDETYAIMLSVPEAAAGETIRWRCEAGGGMPDGNAGYSTDAGYSWTQNVTADCDFRAWGNPVLEVEGSAAFMTYVEDGDWLLVTRYLNEYPPYYQEDDALSSFYLQLVDENGIDLLAQVALPDWGYKPGAIYLSTNMTIPLEWGEQYRMRLYGDFAGYPIAECPLFAASWWGDDLTRLDSWVRVSATQMETYYGLAFTEYIAGKGIVLNEDGGVIFANNIPALDEVRPGLFEIVTSDTGFEAGEFTHAYADSLAWQTFMGPQLTAAFTAAGNVVGLGGATIGALLGFLIYACVAAFAFPPGHAIAAIVLPSPILLFVWGTGLAELALMGICLGVAVILFIWQFWFRGG